MQIDQEIINFKKYLIENNISGIALDIDDTLSQTKKCWFESFSRIIGNPENLTNEEFCQKYHLIQDAPYFQTPEALELIQKLAHSPETYCDLEIIDNSSLCVNKINQIIPIVAYITMRPQISLEVTQKWLDQNNFPKAKLISCPNSVSRPSAVDWKVSVLEELFPQIVGIVDDSLSVAEKISPDYPGKIYFYNTDPQSLISKTNIIPCPTWDCVLDKIKP